MDGWRWMDGWIEGWIAKPWRLYYLWIWKRFVTRVCKIVSLIDLCRVYSIFVPYIINVFAVYLYVSGLFWRRLLRISQDTWLVIFPHSKSTRNINNMEDCFCTKSVFDQWLYLYDKEIKLEEKGFILRHNHPVHSTLYKRNQSNCKK